MKSFNRVTPGKQHKNRYNCILNTFRGYKDPLP